jgi:hypothetical protein
MIIEAPASKFRKSNLKIYITGLILVAAWCAYDGYFNEKWIKEHTDAKGNPETYLVVNRSAPKYLVGLAVLLGAYLFVISSKKVTADDTELVIDGKKRITYDSMEKIDKTYFASKGYFVVTLKDSSGKEAEIKLSDRKYDNLGAILDKLVEKIS